MLVAFEGAADGLAVLLPLPVAFTFTFNLDSLPAATLTLTEGAAELLEASDFLLFPSAEAGA